MMPRRGQSACEGAVGEQVADATGVAFQQEAQGLGRMEEQEAEHILEEPVTERRLQDSLRLQEVLRLQKQVMDRRLQDALRVEKQRIATVLGEAVRRMEEKLQDKEDAIRALQQKLQVFEERMAAVEEGSMASKRLEDRMQALEGSLQRALDQFFPRVEALLCHAENPSRPEATRISSPTPTTAAYAIGGASAGAREEEREKQRVLLRMQEVEERKAIAAAFPCPLGEQLCRAANEGWLNDIRRLLDSGADVNYSNRAGWTPLLYASSDTWNIETVSLLLEEGADVNAVNAYGMCALHFASMWTVHCVPVLIRAGAEVDARDENGATPLHRAAVTSNAAAARSLVAAGARKDLKGWGADFKGKTPYDVANSVAIRKLLLP